MAYQVDKYNGTFLVSVADGTIDNTTDLKLVGRNFSGYGEVQNENFLHLLESFSNSVEPERPVSGQVWFDTNNLKLKFYDGRRFRTASGAEIGASPPVGLSQGDLWFDSQTNQLSAWNGSNFVLIGPQSAPGFGTSQIVTEVVKDNNNTSHVILRAVVGGITTAVFSNDDDYTLDSSNTLAGFSETGRQIKKGITLNSVNGTTGISDSAGFRFFGTATNAEKLGGLDQTRFVRTDGSEGFTTAQSFADLGFTVGNPVKALKIYINSDQNPAIENQVNGKITISSSNPTQPTDKLDFLTFSRQQAFVTDSDSLNSIYPGATGLVNLGLESRKFKNIWSENLKGELVGDVHGNVIGDVTGDLYAQTSPSTTTKIFDQATQQFTAQQFTGQFVGSLNGLAASAITANKLTNLDPSDVHVPGFSTVPTRSATGTISAILFDGKSTDTQRIDGKVLDVNKNPNTVVLRSIGGDVDARFFNGVASAAKYADLAEKYTTDKTYPIGTVMMIGTESHEAQACTDVGFPIGVISAEPAYLMNSEIDGQAIGLKGRVPVRVVGPITKGQPVYVSSQGTAKWTSVLLHYQMVGIALESSSNPEEKLIECVLKV